MQRTQKTFSLLQATAVVSSLAVLLWSTGALTFRFAEAANLISLSDVISDSAPEAPSDHTITFTTSQGLAAGKSIEIKFDNDFDTNSIEAISHNDIELTIDNVVQTLGATSSNNTWGVSASGQVITIASDSGTIDPDDEVVIKIGTHVSGALNQIINPENAGSYTVNVELGGVDTGETRVMILSPVVVTAVVETIFNFTVSGVADSEEVNSLTTTDTSTADTIDFGELTAGVEKTMAQDLRVETNAKDGFSISLIADQQLTSSNGATIDAFIDGSEITSLATADSWTTPSATLGSPDTYGHWGFTAEVDDLGLGINPTFVSVPTSNPLTFFSYNGPTGALSNEGVVRVGYQVEISALQEAANDYTATITYVATPVF